MVYVNIEISMFIQITISRFLWYFKLSLGFQEVLSSFDPLTVIGRCNEVKPGAMHRSAIYLKAEETLKTSARRPSECRVSHVGRNDRVRNGRN